MAEEKISVLRGEGLTKVFGVGGQKTVAVDHVDFNFYAGEVISIVGESLEHLLRTGLRLECL